MTVINTNISAMFAQNTLTENSRLQAEAMQQLSTGVRINSAKDDAAGLAISQNMTSQIRGLNQAVKNANDGISMLQTADGAMSTQSDMLQRMRELAIQSASGTFSEAQRGYLNTEFKALTTQINKISNETLWNGTQILTGGAGDATSGLANDTFTFQTGQEGNDTTQVRLRNMGTGQAGLKLTDAANPANDVTIESQPKATAAIQKLSDALDYINSQRADIGAVTNQLTYAAENMTNIATNVSASRSQIMDTDYALATTQLAKSQIIAQAATAMLAQANQQPQSVLALLK